MTHSADPAAESRAAAQPFPGLGDDLDLLEELFAEAAASKGVEGRKVFAALKQGVPFGKALAVKPESIEFLYFRARKWFLLGRDEKAEPIFRALCVLEPETADFWIGLGACRRARSAWHEALFAFDIAARVRPEWPIPHFHKLEILVRLHKWADAAAELQAFESMREDGLDAHLVKEAGKYRVLIEMHAPAEPEGAAK
jgi:tetratricopeptide (TPR) repeat protein